MRSSSAQISAISSGKKADTSLTSLTTDTRRLLKRTYSRLHIFWNLDLNNQLGCVGSTHWIDRPLK